MARASTILLAVLLSFAIAIIAPPMALAEKGPRSENYFTLRDTKARPFNGLRALSINRPNENQYPIYLAQASCSACGQQSRSCHAPCKRMGKGPGKGSCHAACKSAYSRCKASCAKSAGASGKPAGKPVDLTKQVRPQLSVGGPHKHLVETRKSLVAALPPSIDDVTAIIEQQKQKNPERVAELKMLADSEPFKNVSKSESAQFYYNRGLAAGEIGRFSQAIDDLTMAVGLAKKVDAELHKDATWKLASAAGNAGYYELALEHYNASLKLPMRDGQRLVRSAVVALVRALTGDIKSGEDLMREVEVLLANAQGFRKSTLNTYGNIWLGRAKRAKGEIALLRGDPELAENLFRDALYLVEKDLARGEDQEWGRFNREICRMRLSTSLLRQGRLVEAEVFARKALIDTLAEVGRYSTETPRVLEHFASVLAAQGRYDEAEKMLKASIETMLRLGYPENNGRIVRARSTIASSLFLSGDSETALTLFNEIERSVESAGDPVTTAQFYSLKDWLLANATKGRHEKVVPIVRELLASAEKTKVQGLAIERGALAIALMRAGDRKSAFIQFKKAVPELLSGAWQNQDTEYTLGSAVEHRINVILDAYLDLLFEMRGTSLENELRVQAVEESFRIGDVARGQLVQNAVAAASARALVKDSKLAELIRAEQDARKRLTAKSGLLASLLARPSDHQDSKIVADLNNEVIALRKGVEDASALIKKQYPDYARLLNPEIPGRKDIQAALRPDETYVSIYLGRDRIFVWAVPKSGEIQTSRPSLSVEQVQKIVAALRESLNPEVETLGDIPDFDVQLAYKLFVGLLEPVRTAWHDANSLLVSTNGALGQLPFSVLPTERINVSKEGPLFQGYRDVKWLARTHAVTLLPSASTFVTLRSLPVGKPGRKPFLGFGDPFFNQEQLGQRDKVADATASAISSRGAIKTRGLPIRLRAAPSLRDREKTDLSNLPALPDTGDEVRGIALALKADVSEAIKLGLIANEDTVHNSDLSKYRVIAFATHGLVPGDLSGLREPALAPSAPDIAKTSGDGLLTMSEIMGLKLDADWVVLSACNTGTGRGAGAEAVSGLGRAFFYAGTRSLLVSSWPVETVSAGLLTTDVFRRLTHNAELSRAVALQQAMLHLMNQPAVIDDKTGEPIFYYSHPIFWAPFILVGDGGG